MRDPSFRWMGGFSSLAETARNRKAWNYRKDGLEKTELM
jgi:hypothetical protein